MAAVSCRQHMVSSDPHLGENSSMEQIPALSQLARRPSRKQRAGVLDGTGWATAADDPGGTARRMPGVPGIAGSAIGSIRRVAHQAELGVVRPGSNGLILQGHVRPLSLGPNDSDHRIWG
jgi:hypothetical protein